MRKGKRLLSLVGAAVLRARKPIYGTASAAVFVSALCAQTITTGDVTGTVTDPSGAVIPNATVTLTSVDNGQVRNVTANNAGSYRFSTLQPGSYQISASSPGLSFNPAKLTVNIGQVQTVNITLQPQSVQQTVDVTETVPLIQSDNANIATSFDSKQIANLPAPGNDMTAYAFTAPGVTLSTGGGYGNFSAFGLPGVSNLYTINGSDNMDPYLNLNNSGASNLTLGANEISEVAVVLNGYTGQYGRQAGANVNYVTKSGTNQFHGNAAWWYNDRVLNANDWFNNATGTPRPRAISNEWADSIGGPIKKDKLFFYVDNEGLRYVLPGGGAPVYVPTPDFASFVQSNIAANNPSAAGFYKNIFSLYNGAPGANRAVPLTSATDPQLGCGDLAPLDESGNPSAPSDPNALAAYNAGFGTTRPCASTFRSTVNNLNTEWLAAARVDYLLGSNDRLYWRYNTDHGVQATGTDPINSVFNANSVQPSYAGQMGWTHNQASSVNQLLLSASYYVALFGPPNLKQALSTFPTTITFVDGLLNDMGGADSSYPQGRKVRQWQLVDDYSFVKGNHTIGVGTNIRKNFISTYAYGPNTSGLVTINSMTDFLNGSLENGSLYSQAFSRIGAIPLTMYSAGFYGQDVWKVSPKLTLTLAIRFDRNSNISCSSGCFTELTGQPFAQAAHLSTAPYNAAITTGLKHAFPQVESVVPEPRIGFAYSPTRMTVLRGGFGIFSDLYQGLIADRLITNSPNVASFTTSSGTLSPGDPASVFATVANSAAAFQSGFASGATLAQLQASVPGFARPNFNTVQSKIHNPKFYEWNFEWQQELTNSLMFSANYVGNHGRDLNNQNLLANAYDAAGFAGLPTAARDPRFGEIRELTQNGWSSYNGLVTSLRFRVGSSLTANLSYTWSHALDTCSNECLTPFQFLTTVGLRYQVSPYGLKGLNYGSSDYDIRHSVNANYVYTVPSSFFGNRLAKSVLGGWTAAGTVFFHTGYPFSVVDSAIRSRQGVKNASGIATTTFLADYVGGPSSMSCTTPNVQCIDPALFAPATAQKNFGNISRNSFRGPHYFDTDLNLNRTFSLTERFKLLVGANFFNILNHPNFDLPDNNLASGTFGQIISTVSAPTSAYGSFVGSDVSGRIIQTQIKLTF